MEGMEKNLGMNNHHWRVYCILVKWKAEKRRWGWPITITVSSIEEKLRHQWNETICKPLNKTHQYRWLIHVFKCDSEVKHHSHWCLVTKVMLTTSPFSDVVLLWIKPHLNSCKWRIQILFLEHLVPAHTNVCYFMYTRKHAFNVASDKHKPYTVHQTHSLCMVSMRIHTRYHCLQ